MNNVKLPHILVIDDDEMVCMMLSDILGKEGFEIVVASNGREGLEQCRDVRPDMILLDVMMPEMDGFACLQEVRKLAKTELLPIAMLTATDDVESIHRAFDLGATDFISKPIHWPTLSHRIRYMLRATETLKKLAKNEATLRNAQKLARLGHWEWDVAADQLACSDEAIKVLGLDRQITRKNLSDLFRAVHPADVGKVQKATRLCLQSGVPFNLDFRSIHGDGTEHFIHAQGAPLRDEDNAVVQLAGLVQDITEYRRIEDQVRILSHYDGLTGLANRTTFKEILSQGISYCDRYGAKLAALFVSIDKFKRINETYGPSVGDSILRQFTERLERAVRESDYVAVATEINYTDATISRLGGNEFTVLTNHIKDSCDMVKIAKRIIQGTEIPYLIDDLEVFLTLSIGICVYPGDGHDVDSFIQNGEFAMHHARELGHNQHEFFSKSLNVEAFKKLAMENSLRRAIERNELMLYFQPKYNIITGYMIGMEALLRWRHPEMGLVPPLDFIPLAEESGLIITIGEWVIDAACRQNKAWQAAGMSFLPVAVNVSGAQFLQKNFASKVADILARTGLAPECLELEMTESILMGDVSTTMHTLKRVKEMGIKISVDDFGTGYSSLSYLNKFPIDELKVDRSFVMHLPGNKGDAMITSAIINLAHSLDLQVVAEGVETEEQADFLSRSGCQVMQGYLYSKPVPADEILELAGRKLPQAKVARPI